MRTMMFDDYKNEENENESDQDSKGESGEN